MQRLVVLPAHRADCVPSRPDSAVARRQRQFRHAVSASGTAGRQPAHRTGLRRVHRPRWRWPAPVVSASAGRYLVSATNVLEVERVPGQPFRHSCRPRQRSFAENLQKAISEHQHKYWKQPRPRRLIRLREQSPNAPRTCESGYPHQLQRSLPNGPHSRRPILDHNLRFDFVRSTNWTMDGNFVFPHLVGKVDPNLYRRSCCIIWIARHRIAVGVAARQRAVEVVPPSHPLVR